MVSRVENMLDFSIYRKDTYCERLIPLDSFHDHRHKMAAFHSMIHRLTSITRSTVNYETELNYIHRLARFNGYNKNVIDNVLRKHLMKMLFIMVKLLETLKPDSQNICISQM